MSDNLSNYPLSPGFKRAGTSEDAARAIEPKAGTLRARVLVQLSLEPLTADECAKRLGLSILSVRPRLSELEASKLITDSGDRRPNASGKRAIVWKVAA